MAKKKIDLLDYPFDEYSSLELSQELERYLRPKLNEDEIYNVHEVVGAIRSRAVLESTKQIAIVLGDIEAYPLRTAE